MIKFINEPAGINKLTNDDYGRHLSTLIYLMHISASKFLEKCKHTERKARTSLVNLSFQWKSENKLQS